MARHDTDTVDTILDFDTCTIVSLNRYTAVSHIKNMAREIPKDSSVCTCKCLEQGAGFQALVFLCEFTLRLSLRNLPILQFMIVITIYSCSLLHIIPTCFTNSEPEVLHMAN